MNKNLHFSANTKNVLSRFYLTYLSLGMFFLFYEIIHLNTDSKYVISYSIFIVLFLKFLWDFLTDKFVKTLHFNDNENKLNVVESNYLNKEKLYTVNYSEINYEFENSNGFWKIIIGKKILTILKNNLELMKIGKSSGFNYQQISEIESKLNEIKSAYR